MSKQVMLPYGWDPMLISRVAKANGCTDKEVVLHAKELAKEGFGITFGKGGYVWMRYRGSRGVLRKPGQSEYPEYWGSLRHKEVVTNYLNISPYRVSIVSGLVTHEHL